MWHLNMFFAASDTQQLCLYKPKWLCLWTESSAHIRHLIIAMRLERLIKNRYCTARLGTLWHGTALMQSKFANYGSLHKSTAQEPRAIDETLDECVLLKCGVSVSLPPSKDVLYRSAVKAGPGLVSACRPPPACGWDVEPGWWVGVGARVLGRTLLVSKFELTIHII